MKQVLNFSIPFVVGPANNGLSFDDSSLAPIGYEDLCKLPTGTVYNVKNYGAKGDGIVDDTPAVKQALAAIKASNATGILYFPTGTYNLCPQLPQDATPWGDVVFNLAGFPMKVVFIGDGPSKTILKGFMPGLKDPKTTWKTLTTDGSEPSIERFIMFQAITSPNTPAGGFQIRSMTVDGQAGYTGNFLSGGDSTTGDGWDWFHKGVRIDGSSQVDDVLIFNSQIINFRGEIVYSGGTAAKFVGLFLSKTDSSNASCISCSTDMLIHSSDVGQDVGVYNGTENFCITAQQKMVCINSRFSGKAQGLVYIGVDGASCLIDNCDITNSGRGILFSETAHNVTVRNSRFLNNTAQAMIDSVLGLYPQGTGFSNFLIENNTFIKTGYSYLCQGYGGGYDWPGFTLRNNTVTSGALIGGSFLGTFTNFNIDGNILGDKAISTGDWAGNVALWTNNVRLPGSFIGNHEKFDEFSPTPTAIFAPISDLTFLNDNRSSPIQNAEIDSTKLHYYPVGFTTKFKIGKTNWVLKANPAWNNFSADVPVTNTTTIRFNANKLFELV